MFFQIFIQHKYPDSVFLICIRMRQIIIHGNHGRKGIFYFFYIIAVILLFFYHPVFAIKRRLLAIALRSLYRFYLTFFQQFHYVFILFLIVKILSGMKKVIQRYSFHWLISPEWVNIRPARLTYCFFTMEAAYLTVRYSTAKIASTPTNTLSNT